MNNPKEIKEILNPILVAQYYLGQGTQKGNKIWYKSPFRNEKTASFMATKNEFHDFGDGWHGDVIDFVGRYYNTNFITSMKILSKDFGLPEDEKMSKEFETYIQQKKEQNMKIQSALDNWFDYTFLKICKEIEFSEKIIKFLTQESLKVIYDRQTSLEILWELFFEAVNDYDKKIELWRNKEEIEKCLNASNAEV